MFLHILKVYICEKMIIFGSEQVKKRGLKGLIKRTDFNNELEMKVFYSVTA